MHIGTTTTRSKMEAMYFPTSLTKSRKQQGDHSTAPDPIYLNNGQNQIQFTSSFKYLGSIITSMLTKDTKIQARTKKASQQIGRFHYIFQNRDIDKRVKYWIYTMNLSMLSTGVENLGTSTKETETSFNLSTILPGAIMRQQLQRCSK